MVIIMNTKMKFIRLGVIIGILFVSMLSLTVTLPKNAEALLPPLAEIRWQEGNDVQEAQVDPGKHGTVIFNGYVNCELVAGGAFQKVVVSLQATSDQSWPLTINPPQITFNPNTDADMPFSVTATVPSETSFYTSDTIRVSGRGVAYPGATQDVIDEVTATIKVKQFYKFSLECSKAYQEVSPSERLVFNLKILNQGNAADTYFVIIKNLEDLADKGWTVTLSTNIIEVEENDEKVVQIPVGTPIKFNLWINEIQNIVVEVKSDQEERNTGFTIPREFPLTVRQRGFSTPGFDPLFTILAFVGIAVVLNTRRIRNKKRR